ncbi:MAG: DUF2271 domain-containing protein [Sphingomonas sp.]|nr:MAG: DUF2271 domain-containing protein [Sphingomonas sp.]
MRTDLLSAPVLLLATSPAFAAGIDLSLTIPTLKVAEYHRPYIAIWIEPEGGEAKTLAVWYDTKLKDKEGEKWLRDIRTWWRKSGRTLTFPVDGVSGATRAPGTHKISFTEGKGPLGKLAPGKYELVVEASREVGDKELLRLPFQWPPKGGEVVKAAGAHELGAVTATLKR